jgi:hypothetical protein
MSAVLSLYTFLELEMIIEPSERMHQNLSGLFRGCFIFDAHSKQHLVSPALGILCSERAMMIEACVKEWNNIGQDCSEVALFWKHPRVASLWQRTLVFQFFVHLSELWMMIESSKR